MNFRTDADTDGSMPIAQVAVESKPELKKYTVPIAVKIEMDLSGDVPVFAVAVAVVTRASRIVRKRTRRPLLRASEWSIVRRVPDVLQKNVVWIFRNDV